MFLSSTGAAPFAPGFGGAFAAAFGSPLPPLPVGAEAAAAFAKAYSTSFFTFSSKASFSYLYY